MTAGPSGGGDRAGRSLFPAMPTRRLPGTLGVMMTRLCYLIAPALLICYGVARLTDGLDGSYGPGLAWTAGHVLFLLALAAFAVVLPGLRRELGRFPVVTAFIVAAGLAGLAAFIRSVLVDLLVGFQATSHAGMAHLDGRYATFPAGLPTAVSNPLDNAGPPLFILSLLTLTVLLTVTRPRGLRWWSPVLAAAGFALITASLSLLPAGGACLLAALLPVARMHSSRPAAGRARSVGRLSAGQQPR